MKRAAFHEELIRCSQGVKEEAPENLEELWLNILQDPELQGHLPRIYRSIPKWHHRDDRQKTMIKKGFRNLKALKKLTVARPLLKLYSDIRLPKMAQIAIVTEVLADGLGDWAAAMAAAEILSGSLESLEIALYFLHKKPIPSHSPYPVFSGPAMQPDWIRQLKKKDLVLSLPTNTTLNMKQLQRIGEYGFLESGWFHPESGGWSMGLNPLELGVMIPQKKTCEFDSSELRAWTQTSNAIFAAYLATLFGGKVYLTALLHAKRHDSRNIDLICPDASWWLKWIEERSIPAYEGVKHIELIWRDKVHRVPFREEGKTVRILIPERLSQNDVCHLFQISELFLGVRGNQSWSEAIVTGKPFFYDGREHSRYFFQDLVSLVRRRVFQQKTRHFFELMYSAFIAILPPETGEWVDETHFEEKKDWQEIGQQMGDLLFDREVELGFSELSSIIQKEHAFNDTLPLLAKRALHHRFHPKLQQSEERFLDLYVEGIVPFSMIVKNKEIRG